MPGATGDYHSNLEAKFDAAVHRLVEEDTGDGIDLGFLHIKAVDDAAHDRNVDLRVRGEWTAGEGAVDGRGLRTAGNRAVDGRARRARGWAGRAGWQDGPDGLTFSW